MATRPVNPGVPTFAKFIIGGLSGLTAQCASHPMDVLKVRMQIMKVSVREAIIDVNRTNGIRGFYAGLGAGALRQLTYSTTRLGVYNTLLDIGLNRYEHLNYAMLVSMGMISGVIGSFVGTPTDVALVRMIGDANLPKAQRKNYRNAFHVLGEIWRKDGIFGLWRGTIPTMGRGALVNGVQLGTYSSAKTILKDSGYFEEGTLLQFLAAMISGLFMCVASLPVDVAKTRIQSWSAPGKPPSIFDTLGDVIRKDGIMALWRGFVPYYTRGGPATIITMVVFEQLNNLYRNVIASS